MAISPQRTKVEVSSTAGVKRPAPTPSLLPAFEPYSSSPPLPRPLKRVACNSPTRPKPKRSSPRYGTEKHKYPTPVPTSSTGIVSSPPPPVPYSRRPRLPRAFSALSERAPLSTMPMIELDAGGEPTLMGRSGKSSDYQLSTNKLISRVHVRAAYIPANPPNPAKVEVVCTGWNGVKVHCQGKAWELGKDSSFTSESQDADIMVDVQDARVLLQWPKIGRNANTPETDSAGDDENSPRQAISTAHPRSPFSSPLGQRPRLHSPVSPSPAVLNAVAANSADLFSGISSLAPVQVYEDQPSDGEGGVQLNGVGEATQSTQYLSQPLGLNSQIPQSEEPIESFSDQDEENDPIIHSFGPFGENLLPRMANFTAGSSPPHRSRVSTVKQASLSPSKRSSSESTKVEAYNEVLNHVINQLAYSRLSSTPLSTLMSNLPTELKNASPASKENARLSSQALKLMIDRTQCIGEVCREGKDAAGKPLESEYYYIPDMDLDEGRRDAVVEGLRKPGLRACRKQHKQYYWRKPK